MPEAPLLTDSLTEAAVASLPPFVCSWTNGGPDAAWMHMAGELDVATVPQLEDALDRAPVQARVVVLDLRELVFLDSAGVHAIVNASIRARQAGRRMVLLRGPANVDRMFSVTDTLGDVEIGDADAMDPPVGAML
jgi:anti-sigma B factor antagonist